MEVSCASYSRVRYSVSRKSHALACASWLHLKRGDDVAACASYTRAKASITSIQGRLTATVGTYPSCPLVPNTPTIEIRGLAIELALQRLQRVGGLGLFLWLWCSCCCCKGAIFFWDAGLASRGSIVLVLTAGSSFLCPRFLLFAPILGSTGCLCNQLRRLLGAAERCEIILHRMIVQITERTVETN